MRLNEIRDLISQFAHLKSKRLFGFDDLPQSVITSVSTHFKTVSDFAITRKALEEGYPLFINPILEYHHQKEHITVTALLTLPVITNVNNLCTVQKLKALQYWKMINVILVHCCITTCC